MTEIHIFLFSLFPPNRSDKEWQLCTTEGPTPVLKVWGGGGKGRAIDGRNIYFLFSYFFFPNMSGISVYRPGYSFHSCDFTGKLSSVPTAIKYL